MLIENNEGSMPTEVTDQSDQTGNQDSNQENNTLLDNEKIYAKKMRQRAQEAEKQLSDLKAQVNEQKTAQLEEQGKYKEMYENLKTKATAWENDSKEYNKFVNAEKETLLNSLPEDDRETFKDLKLTQLKKVVDKVLVKPEAPKVIHGNVSPANSLQNKSFNEMTDAEREQWHNQIVSSKS